MIRDLMKLIIKTILLIYLICIITLCIDLYRVDNNKLPIFSTVEYNSKNRIQLFRGMLYIFTRKVYASPNEALNESSDKNFKIVIYNIRIK